MDTWQIVVVFLGGGEVGGLRVAFKHTMSCFKCFAGFGIHLLLVVASRKANRSEKKGG